MLLILIIKIFLKITKISLNREKILNILKLNTGKKHEK